MSTLITRGSVRQHWVALRALVALTVVSVAATLVVSAIGLIALPAQAHGSVVTSGGRAVGSALIGQSFTTGKGAALPQWFQSRPSAVGYDGGGSGASNLGPDSADLRKAIEDRKAAITALDGTGTVPADALTASASGLDPHISPEYARLQSARVARVRGMDVAVVRRLVESAVQAPDLGYLGQPTVNVLQLNLALSKADPAGDGR